LYARKNVAVNLGIAEQFSRRFSIFAYVQNFSHGNFSRGMAFFTRTTPIKTLCFQSFVFGQQRANNKIRRGEDTPRIPLGD